MTSPTVDHSRFKLGKAPARHDPRTFRLASYLTPELPQAPARLDYYSAMIDVGPMLNDEVGDCTVAAPGHLVQSMTAVRGVQHTPSDVEILAAYCKACGYNPNDPDTDRGGVMLDVLKFWKDVGIGGHKIEGFVALNPSSREHFKVATWLFGGVYLGLALPESAKTQPVWRVAMSGLQGSVLPGTWGGHAVSGHGYDDEGPDAGVDVCTWGIRKRVSWSWIDAGYCEEAYVVIAGDDWIDRVTGLAPSGFNIEALRADLALVAR